ncbi:MAG: alpha/beta hydrolase [Chloroflexi bacterium]|nr:alpha/beta hydrolase [Chloroflexota bacterium]
MQEPTCQYVMVRDIRLRYVDWGGDGPVLLLFHGDMRTSRSWDAVSRRLAGDYRVIALDARGHGDSDWTPRGYRFAERVNDLAAFCEALELRQVIGVAHSTGGVVMALCAQRHPGMFSRLALMEPMVVVDDRFHKMVAGREHAERSTWKSRDELDGYLKQHPATSRWHPEVLRDVVAHEAYKREDGLYDMKWSSFTFNWKDRDGDHVDLKPVFAELGLPILFIRSSGHQTRIKELNEVQDGIPDFHRLTIENTGHNMYMERPDAIADSLKKFAAGEALPATV